MQILSFQEINEYCEVIRGSARTISNPFGDHIEMLMTHGCRPSELRYFKTWKVVNTGLVDYKPLKNNNVRSLLLEAQSGSFFSYTVEPDPNIILLNAKYLSRYVGILRPYPVFVGTKEITSYIFRYHYIKYLHNAGYSVPEIMVFTGHTNASVVLSYINCQIWCY